MFDIYQKSIQTLHCKANLPALQVPCIYIAYYIIHAIIQGKCLSLKVFFPPTGNELVHS